MTGRRRVPPGATTLRALSSEGCALATLTRVDAENHPVIFDLTERERPLPWLRPWTLRAGFAHELRVAVTRREGTRAGQLDVAMVEVQALRLKLVERAIERAHVDARPEAFDSLGIEGVECRSIAIDHRLH